MSRHMQACLVLKQFEYIQNVTEYVNKNYQRVKSKFLRAIDYVENTNIDSASTTRPPSREKGNIEENPLAGLTNGEKKYLQWMMIELAEWQPGHSNTKRVKKFVNVFAAIGAAIGSILNAWQIKKIKQNIAILQETMVLQGQKIQGHELA